MAVKQKQKGSGFGVKPITNTASGSEQQMSYGDLKCANRKSGLHAGCCDSTAAFQALHKGLK